MKKRFVPAYIQWLLYSGLFLLVLMTILRIILIKMFPPSTTFVDYPFASVLALGFRYDLRDVSIILTLLFILSLIPALHPFKKKAGKKVAFIIWTIAVLWMVLFYIVDFANYAYLQERLNSDLLNLLKDTKESFKMMWQTYPIIWLLLALVLAVLGIVGVIRLFYNRIKKNRVGNIETTYRIVVPIVFFLVMAFGIFGRIGQYPLRWSDAFSFGNDYAAKMSLNPFQAFFSSLKFRNETYKLDEVKAAYPLMAQYLGVDHPDKEHLDYTRTIVGNDSAPKPNIVVVVCESFSYYKSSMSGNKLDPTPYFNKMSQEGTLFDRCFTPSYGTARGVWATMTGIPDIDPNKTSSRNPKAVNQHLIMNDFKGYDKYYFIGGSLSWANIRGFLSNNIAGLKTYEQDDYDAPKIDVWGVSDKHVFLKANEVFSNEKKPFIAVVQTSDNHRPYTIPEEDRAAFKTKNVPQAELQKNGFASNEEFNAFRYTDFCYQQFMEAAKKSPYFKNTIFLFIGDHGIRGDASSFFPAAAWNEELSSEHVPLLIYSPNLLPEPKRHNNFVSQVDVMPTVAGLSKISYTNTTIGRDILSPAMMNQPDRYASFIYDYSNQLRGIVKDSTFFSYIPGGNIVPKYQTVTKENINLSDVQKSYYKQLTDAIFKTSQYMLINNKVR